ncbi:MAG TPA: multidrug effflux MFS transporter [Allosphingosinicella sp.]|uniref:multidrug effflux MFS transporter n=1 Tax=Allosphingosinicella sp. TaxID=2823234 RepID=UPI002EDA5776
MREFVVLMAALMASNALAIDSMLPALPAIGDALGVTEDNRRQLVITTYLIGFGIAQIVYGPLADRFGRKGLLVGSMIFFAIFSALAGLAGSFVLLLAARLMQGFAAAATRVLVVAVVRDRYEGAAMARIMSLTMIVFMVVPVLAPTFGQAVLAVASWRHIFIGLAVYGLLLGIWSALRLPETLRPEDRRPLSFAAISSAAAQTLSNRMSAGNTIAVTLAFGALFAFISSVQQIVFDVFGAPELIGLVFACIAGPMAFSSYANSRLVTRLGSRTLLLRALTVFTAISAIHLVITLTLGETLWTFVVLQALTMGCFGLVGANAGALAMEPLGHIAGTASSLQGLITTVGGALIGFAIGQAFDGTTVPLVAGFAICGLLALLTAIWANRPPRPAHDQARAEA